MVVSDWKPLRKEKPPVDIPSDMQPVKPPRLKIDLENYEEPPRSEELAQILANFDHAKQTVRDRNLIYRTSHWKHGAVMAGLFPEGIRLKGKDDFTRFNTLNNIIIKLVRYCENWDQNGHADSIGDLGAYAFILETIDQRINKGENPNGEEM